MVDTFTFVVMLALKYCSGRQLCPSTCSEWARMRARTSQEGGTKTVWFGTGISKFTREGREFYDADYGYH